MKLDLPKLVATATYHVVMHRKSSMLGAGRRVGHLGDSKNTVRGHYIIIIILITIIIMWP